jgi:signal transduction histidine kinase
MRDQNESRTPSSSVSVGTHDGVALRGPLDINRLLRSVAYASARAERLVKRAMMFPDSGRRTAQRYLKQASTNNRAPRVFTSAKLAMLKLLASRDEAGEVDFVGAVTDVSAIRLAERELSTVPSGLARVTRETSLGEINASIAHEVNQPLGAIMFNAEACVAWLDCDPPNLNEAHAALKRIFRDGTRAGEVIRRIRALAKNTDTKMAPLDLNDVLSEALSFVHHELLRSRVVARIEHAGALPVILADKIQLQQVILNLLMNGIDAMQSITDRPRELVIRSEQDDAQHVRVTVTDCGVGFPADSADRLFNTLFTTKSSGMGMGLSICRSIIELHGGRIWAVPNMPYGASIQLTLPLHLEAASR